MTEAETAPTPQESSDRRQALARVAAAIAVDVDEDTLQSLVRDALSAGASETGVVATLFEVAPLIGSVRLVAAAPDLAAAIGYDVDLAFERLDGEVPQLGRVADGSGPGLRLSCHDGPPGHDSAGAVDRPGREYVPGTTSRGSS